MKIADLFKRNIGALLIAGALIAGQSTAWADPKLTNVVTTLLSSSPISAGTTGTFQVVVVKGTGAFNFFALMSVTNTVPAGVTVTFNPGSFDYNTGPASLKTGQMLVALSPGFSSTNFNLCVQAQNSGSSGDVTVNCGTSVSTVSTNPPSCSVSGPSNSCPNTAGLIFTDTSNAATPKFSWSVTGNGSIVGPATNVTVSVTSGAAGSFTAICTVTDLANNKSNTCNKVVSVTDTNAPTITTCATNIIGIANGSCQAAVPNFTNAVVASDNCSAVSITQSPTIGTLVGFGTNTVTIFVADANGNTNSTCTAKFIVRDTTAPNIATCATNITGSANGSCQAAVPNFTNAVVASDSCSAVSITQSPTIGTLVGLGTNTVTIFVADTNGNTNNTCTAKFIVVDTTAPNITTCATNITGFANGSCQAAVPNFTSAVSATENCGGLTITQAPTAGTLIGVGTNTVTITATDAAGNFSTCSAAFIVLDNTPPTISCPANVITNLDLHACIISNVVLGVPSATNDNCGVATVSNNAPVGFSAGVTSVAWTVTDIHGNSASCTQTVTIVDITPPDISQGPTNQTGNAGISCTAVVPSFTNGVTATTMCGKTFTLSQSPLAGASAALGTNTVTVFVVDNAGNTNSSTASFIVQDTTAPVVSTCPSNQSGEATGGGQAAVPNFTGGVVGSDNCSSISVTQLPTAGTLVGLGSNSVTVTVSDSAGNSTNCTVSFVVVDTTPPTITSCAGNKQAEAVSGGQAAVPDFTADVVASDNGGAPTITQSPLAGTLVGVGPHTVTITVADNSGNSTNCTATFTVVDTTPPTISACAGNLMADAGTNCSVAVPDFTGSVTASDNGTLTITQSPLAGALVGFGPHTVTITVADQSANSTNCTATFTVEDTTPPQITCPANKIVLAAPGATNAVVNFSAPLVSDNCGVAGTTCIPASGSVFQIGTTPVSCTVTDNAGLTASCSFNVIVKAVNAAPVANNDNYSVDADTTLTVDAPGVLDNDTDTEGDSLTAVLSNPPAHGTIVLHGDGSFVYKPTAGFTGTDAFKYRANDGIDNSDIATVTIDVNPANHAPIALADSYTTNTNTPLNVTAPGVLANDIDVDGDTLTAIQVGTPAHGMVTFNSDGSFLFTPDTGYVGFDSFSYAATDGVTTSAPIAIVIGVGLNDDAPLAGNDDYSTDEDVPLTIDAPGILGNDMGNGPLTALFVSGPQHGSVTVNTDGSVTYTPSENFNGSDYFVYRANDGIVNSSDAIVTITVNSVNDTPEMAGDQAYGTPQDTTLDVAAPGVLGNATDADGDTLTAVLVGDVSNGMLTLNADGSFSYTPDSGFTGTDSFMVAATDGTLTSTPVTVVIYVGGGNHVPVANNDSFVTDEDTDLVIFANDVLANDIDVDGDELTPHIVALPAHGTITDNGDDSVTYTPEPDFNGTDSFTYRVNDGTVDSGVARVFITVNPVNDAPVVFDSTPSVPEDGSLFVPAPGALDGAYDVDGDAITAILITDVSNGTLIFNPDGSYQYTPTPLFSGTDCFTFAATDGITTSEYATVCVTVNHVNHPPVVQPSTPNVPEDGSLSVPAPGALTGATDADGDMITAILITDVSNGTLNFNADGSYDYTPTPLFSGTDCFTFAGTDGISTSQFATVCITVGHVNHPPVVQNQTPAVDEDNALNVGAPGVLTGATDDDGDVLTAILITQAVNGTAVVNANGSYSYTPNANFHGTDCFTFAATDGMSTSAFATVCVTVNSVNDRPIANNDSYNTPKNTALSVSAPGVLGNDTDVDEDTLSAVLVTGTSHGSLSLGPDGSFVYTPNNNYVGGDAFTYKANDGALDSGAATVTITVTGSTNSAPVASNDSYNVGEDDQLDVAAPGVLGNDTDADDDSLTATLVSSTTHGALTFHADGSFTYVPDDNFHGTDMFTYKANDGTEDSNVATVTINVNTVSGAGDIDLLAGRAGFVQNRKIANHDQLRIKGFINPRGINTNLVGTTMLVTLNGTDVSLPVALDANGNATVQQGALEIKASLSSKNGKYSFSIRGANLAAALGLPNTTQNDLTVLHIILRISGANLDIPVIGGDFETPYRTSAGKFSIGRFNFKKNRILTGVFNSRKTFAKLGKNGGYTVSFRGAIENQNDASITPTGTTRIQIGNDVSFVPSGGASAPGIKAFLLVPTKHTFLLRSTELANTGIPLPGNNAPTSYRLPLQILIPTGGTTNVFETILELKRPDGNSRKWTR